MDGRTGPAQYAGELPLGPLVGIRADATLAQAAQAIIDTGAAFVAVEADPVLILGQRDVVRAVAEGFDGGQAAADVARSDLVFVPEDAHVVGVAAEMVRSHASCALVVDAHYKPLGVLAITTVLAAVLDDLSLASGLRIALRLEHPAGP